MSMQDYLTMATWVVAKYAPGHARDPEAIDRVAYAAMRSDWVGGDAPRRMRAARDAVRKYLAYLASRRATVPLDDLIIDAATPIPDDAAAEAEDVERRRESCRRLLAGLSERQRGCVVLHYLDGRSAEDISRRLRITTSAVHRNLRHGVASMRRVAGA